MTSETTNSQPAVASTPEPTQPAQKLKLQGRNPLQRKRVFMANPHSSSIWPNRDLASV